MNTKYHSLGIKDKSKILVYDVSLQEMIHIKDITEFSRKFIQKLF